MAEIVELSPEALAHKMLEVGPAATGMALGAMDTQTVRGKAFNQGWADTFTHVFLRHIRRIYTRIYTA